MLPHLLAASIEDVDRGWWPRGCHYDLGPAVAVQVTNEELLGNRGDGVFAGQKRLGMPGQGSIAFQHIELPGGAEYDDLSPAVPVHVASLHWADLIRDLPGPSCE